MTRRDGKYPEEVRERTVRLVLDHRDDYASEWAAIRRGKVAINTPHPQQAFANVIRTRSGWVGPQILMRTIFAANSQWESTAG
jgi:hypothetical protein